MPQSKDTYSKCCLSSVRLCSGEEGTNHYICNACNEACDVTDSQTSTPSSQENTNDIDEILDNVANNILDIKHDIELDESFRIVEINEHVTEIKKAAAQNIQNLIAQEANKARIDELIKWHTADSVFSTNWRLQARIKELTPQKDKDA